MATNFNITPNDEVEKFEVEFGEIQRIQDNDFNKLINRPSYAGQTMTGETSIPEVPVNVSQLTNDSNYQNGEEVQNAISEAIADKQDKLTAGANITISEENVISATDTTYTAGNGLNLSNENAFSVDTTVIATQQNLSNETSNRENADIALQGQIDAISASSDVVDIVGTYAELQAYDTSKLKDNDIIKVLQDETQNNATTYYRWNIHTNTFTLIGSEGPYYTKGAADAQFVPQTRTVNSKPLSSNINLTAADVNAIGTGDIVQTTGSNTAKVMSQKATTDALGTKVNKSDVEDHLANTTNPVQNKVIYGLFNDMPSDYFSGDETVNGTGSEVTLNGTIEAKLNDLELKGDTEQQTYAGKNLLAIQDGTYYSGTGVTATVENGVITITGTNTGSSSFVYFNLLQSVTLPAGTYTLAKNVISSVDEPPSYPYVEVRQSNATIVGTDYDNITKTVTLEEPKTIDTIRLYFGNRNGTSVIEPQLEAGSTATSFEPYVGGTASPNPDYPQDVNVVTGTQAIAITGKNLFDGVVASGEFNSSGNINANQSRVYSVDYIKVKPNTQYVSNLQINRVCYYDASKTFLNRSSTYNFTTFTTPADAYYVRFDIASTSDTAHQQIEKGATSTEFQSFYSVNYTVNLGSIELCKIGDYQDYIYKNGDNWYVHKNIGKVVLDGSESWNTFTSGVSYHTYYVDGLISSYRTDTTALYLSNNFTGISTNQRYVNDTFFINNQSRIIISYDDIATVSAFKTWLSSHNTSIYYILATPTDTQITDATLISQLDALYNASSYEDQTNFEVTATSPNLPAILGVSAYKKSLEGTLGAIASINYLIGDVETALNAINNGTGV